MEIVRKVLLFFFLLYLFHDTNQVVAVVVLRLVYVIIDLAENVNDTD